MSFCQQDLAVFSFAQEQSSATQPCLFLQESETSLWERRTWPLSTCKSNDIKTVKPFSLEGIQKCMVTDPLHIEIVVIKTSHLCLH